MEFSDVEIAQYAGLIEKLIWTKRRPPLHLREKVREGQRIEGYEIELFLVRPLFFDPTKKIENSIAKTRYIKSRGVWKVFCKRADMKWHLHSLCRSEVIRSVSQARGPGRKWRFWANGTARSIST